MKADTEDTTSPLTALPLCSLYEPSLGHESVKATSVISDLPPVHASTDSVTTAVLTPPLTFFAWME